MRARKSHFENSNNLDDCEIANHDDRDFINVLVCKSNANEKTSIYPLLKEREEEGSKIIKEMRLVLKPGNNHQIERESQDDSRLLEAFYVTGENFGEGRDSFASVTEKYIRVYDKDMKLRLQFEGLNIRSCQQVHQGYLYTISDNITKPPLITKYYGENYGEPEPLKNFTF